MLTRCKTSQPQHDCFSWSGAQQRLDSNLLCNRKGSRHKVGPLEFHQLNLSVMGTLKIKNATLGEGGMHFRWRGARGSEQLGIYFALPLLFSKQGCRFSSRSRRCHRSSSPPCHLLLTFPHFHQKFDTQKKRAHIYPDLPLRHHPTHLCLIPARNCTDLNK